MRAALGGFGGPLPPMVLQLANGVPFLKAAYVALGYTNYEVLCIGAAGGMGGGIQPPVGTGGSYIQTKGGGGGGGGLHRVKGLLAALPVSCAVVVGTAGADGANSVTAGSGVGVTSGAGGTPSRFNYPLCAASAGNGGSGATNTSRASPSGGNGGAGGIGNAIGLLSGGGAPGATAQNPNNGAPPTLNPPGEGGIWNGTIGSGGGGGAGGTAFWDATVGTFPLPASGGGNGSYWGSDTSFSAPGGAAQLPIFPGFGGGALTTPLNHLLAIYGSRAQGINNRLVVGDGLVIISLT